METAATDGLHAAGRDEVIRAIIDLMDGEAAVDEGVLVRTIRREAAIDLEDDEILCVVRDAGDHGHDAAFALGRLVFLSAADNPPRQPAAPR